jgi:hypothetical protein
VREKGKRTEKITGYTEEVTDEGIADKRLLVIEPEFASVLQRAEINNASAPPPACSICSAPNRLENAMGVYGEKSPTGEFA